MRPAAAVTVALLIIAAAAPAAGQAVDPRAAAGQKLGGPPAPAPAMQKATVPVVQSSTTIPGEELKSLIAGRTVELSTPIGALPIKYRANGTMQGESWGLGMYTGTQSDSGRWWIAENKLCQRWQVWLDAKSNCFELHREGNTVYWVRQDGRRGTATILR